MDKDQNLSPTKALVPVEPTVRYVGSQANALAEEDAKPSGLDFKALLQALRRRWLLALTLAALLAPLATVAAWYVVPNRYTARTLLYVDATQPSILPGLAQGGVSANYQRTQLALVKSRLVLNAALRRPKVAELDLVRRQPDPVEWLEKDIKADYGLAPDILRVTLTGSEPDGLTSILNAVREAYLQEIVEKEHGERREKLAKLKELYTTYDNILHDKRQVLHKLAQDPKIGSGQSQTLAYKQKFALERLAATQKDLLQLQSDLRKAVLEAAGQHTREKYLDKISIPEAIVQERFKYDKGIQRHLDEIAKAEELIEETRRVSARGDKEPALEGFRARLEAAQKALAQRQDELRPRVLRDLREKAQSDVQISAAQNDGRVALLKELEASVAKEVERMMEDTNILNKGSLEIESIRDELAQTEDMARKIGTQMEALKVDEHAQSRVRLLEDATVNANEAKKRRMMAAGGSGLGMLLLTLFGVAWFELRARRISTVEEVKLGAGMRLVGTLPTLPARAAGGLRADRSGPMTPGHRVLLESVDATRTVLLHTVRSENFKAVMVTSASSGEGKTSLSSQLAASLARGGFNTLLIDGDLRRPVLHKLFGLPQGPGLCELLRGEAGVEEVVQPTPLAGLSLIAAGRFDDGALKALARHGSKDVWEDLKSRYDLIVLDSTPVLPVADALLLGQYVDGVVFSILRDVSRMPSVVSACERIGMLGIRILGAVVAGVHSDGYYSSYTYYGAHNQPGTQDEMVYGTYEAKPEESLPKDRRAKRLLPRSAAEGEGSQPDVDRNR
jgi:capsular exopolysaccharide synthesis family protein